MVGVLHQTVTTLWDLSYIAARPPGTDREPDHCPSYSSGFRLVGVLWTGFPIACFYFLFF